MDLICTALHCSIKKKENREPSILTPFSLDVHASCIPLFNFESVPPSRYSAIAPLPRKDRSRKRRTSGSMKHGRDRPLGAGKTETGDEMKTLDAIVKKSRLVLI